MIEVVEAISSSSVGGGDPTDATATDRSGGGGSSDATSTTPSASTATPAAAVAGSVLLTIPQVCKVAEAMVAQGGTG